MAAVLLQVLERTELNKLPKGAQNKLEKFVTELQNANEALRTQHERFKADSEQQYFDIDKRLAESQEQILSATKDLQTLKEENKKLKKRMEQEKELQEKKVEWLTTQLKTKTEELLNTNREKGKEILELRGGLRNSKEQVTRLERQLTSLKQTSESQSKRAEDLNNKLKQSKDEQSSMEEKYRNELNAHIKLSSLYKGSATDMETKNQELSRALEELSKLVKETGEANKALEKKVSEGEELKKRLEAELGEKVKKMEKELENATMKAAGKHCCKNTFCYVISNFHIEMNLFVLYNAYAECQTHLQLEKQETRRVSRVLDEIVQEIESKAPVLKRQREEYESMQRSMASLCNKLEQARTEIYSLQKEKEEAKQRCDTMERDKMRIERQLEDTSAQVCSLLVDLEEARGNQVTREDGSSANISSTSEVISSRQLSFRSVEQLQRQNQSLLSRLRQLEEEKDRQQSQVTSARVSELEASVDKLEKDVEQLKEQRNQQKQLADSNARQRDMYKVLLTQSTGFSLPTQGSDSSSHPAHVRPSVPATRSTPQRAAAAESAQTAQAKAALKQLNDAFTLYKKEKAENDKMSNETNDRLQKQLTDLRSSHAKLTSQLEFSSKRYEMLQDTVAAYRREISALQDRNQKMAATAQRHEHIIHTMSQDLRQANEKLALEEVRVENLTKERDMLRQAESRLCREKEAMLAEQRNQNLLLTNLKTIQLTMERTETETRQQLNNKIEHLEAELSSMKTRLDQEVAQRHALGRTMDAQLLEAKKQLETQNTLQQKTRELLRSSEQQVAALKAQLASAPSEAQLSQSEQELAELKGLLRTAEEQNNELAEQLKNANATVEQYRAVVLTLEDSLKKEKENTVYYNQCVCLPSMAQATAKTLAQQEEQLKKMENIAALQETNRMLKMDRDKLEQELQQAQAKVTKLQSDISPLHHSLSQLSERNGSLQADKRILEEDLKRWKAKTQQLLSQQKDGDVEERQKLATEKEAQQKRITQLAEETAKLKTDLARSSASSNSAQSQLQALRDSVARLTAERDTLKKDVETQKADILEKNKTITQVKKIGRRYKTQYEELKVQHDKNLANQKELQRTQQSSQQSHNQEISNIKTALSQAESKYCVVSLQLSESKNREEQLRQQIAEKEEKTKKVFMGAKTKINQLNSDKEKLTQEIQEVKQNKEELEVRMNALKSQYEGRLLRLDRELRELRETQAQSDPREEPQDQSGAKVGDQTRSADQRQISLKSPAQDRGSSSLSDPPTANIRPTTSTPSPSNKPSPSPGNKATPRASIRPMVTPATVPIPTPTATVMPTTQTDSQEGENHLQWFKILNNGFIFGLQEIPEDCYPALAEDDEDIEEVSQSVPSDMMSSQGSAIVRDVIVIDTDSESRESKEGEEKQEDEGEEEEEEEDEEEEEEEEDDEDEDDAGHSGIRGGEESNEESREAEEEAGEDEPSEASNTEDNVYGASSDSQRPSEPPHSSEHLPECVCVLQQHFFDDDDRMVPSTPTLVVPHRTDGFAEAIHSPQVAGLSTRFRFGPPEDLLPQTSASHSDLGQLASQGGLGMYESPLFLAAHDEDGGGRSVPTTPLQVAAPGETHSVHYESSTTRQPPRGMWVTLFVFPSPGIESSLDSQTDMESTGQQSDDASLPSTSQDPGKVFRL
uniref:Translocated promoter region, nuclear basket protein n=1 Tax=Sander lucioperca TaxID=283035 RepID=A0A8D0B051_SANLU